MSTENVPSESPESRPNPLMDYSEFLDTVYPGWRDIPRPEWLAPDRPTVVPSKTILVDTGDEYVFVLPTGAVIAGQVDPAGHMRRFLMTEEENHTFGYDKLVRAASDGTWDEYDREHGISTGWPPQKPHASWVVRVKQRISGQHSRQQG